MNTLYIIGNGFDRAHGLKTSYWDFRNYLEKYAIEFLVELENMYSIAPFERLDKRFKKNKQIQEKRDNSIFELLWKSFEYCLGEANEAEMLDFSDSIVDDLYLDGGPVGIIDTMDDYWEEQYRFIEKLNGYVYKWIRQVRLSKARPMKKEFIDNSDDYFFTFNYTSVLERIYNIPTNHINHIHGGLTPYCQQAPVLGHGNGERIEQYHERAEQAAEEYDEGKESIYKAIAKFYERTWKNTGRYITFQSDFYKQLKGVNKVEVIGHSFGDVDLPYFIYLKHAVSEDAQWILYCHSKQDEEAANALIKELEFNRANVKIVPSTAFWSK